MKTNKLVALDTNVIIDHLRKRINFREYIDDDADIAVPIPVKAEILCGVYLNYSGNEYEKTLAFFSRTISIPCDDAVAERYAEIKSDLKKNGALVPPNDIWIAACCVAHGLPLLTRDAHFKRIKNLDLVPC